MTAPALVNPERKGTFSRWAPKVWRPEYDRIVAFSVMGKSNIWIAKQLSFTPQHVSNILCQDRAVELAERLHAKMRESIENDIPSILANTAITAAKRVQAVIENDELFEKSPFAVVDRSLDVLKGLSHLRKGDGGNTNTTNINAIVINGAQKSDILEGLAKVAEVKRLHG